MGPYLGIPGKTWYPYTDVTRIVCVVYKFKDRYLTFIGSAVVGFTKEEYIHVSYQIHYFYKLPSTELRDLNVCCNIYMTPSTPLCYADELATCCLMCKQRLDTLFIPEVRRSRKSERFANTMS